MRDLMRCLRAVAAACLPLVFSGCFTMQLWKSPRHESPQRTVTTETPLTVDVKEACYHRTSRSVALRLTLAVDGDEPIPVTLQPFTGIAELTDAMLADPQLRRVLAIQHFQPHAASTGRVTRPCT
jgi:hypothetical protein